MNRGILLLCLSLWMAGCVSGAPGLPFYCSRLKVDCVKRSDHACCQGAVESTTAGATSSTTTSSPDVPQEDDLTSTPEPTPHPTDSQHTEPQEDIIEGQNSDINEVTVHPETVQTPVPDSQESQDSSVPPDSQDSSVPPDSLDSSDSTTQFAPKFCLVIKFNCRLRSQHPCCKLPLPPTPSPSADEAAATPKKDVKTTTTRSAVKTTDSSLKTETSSRPGFIRPNLLASRKPGEALKKTEQPDDEKDKPNSSKPTRSSILNRPPSTTPVPSISTTTDVPLNSLFRRPSRPNFNPSRPSSLGALRNGLCNKLKINCERAPTHHCCKDAQDENDAKSPEKPGVEETAKVEKEDTEGEKPSQVLPNKDEEHIESVEAVKHNNIGDKGEKEEEEEGVGAGEDGFESVVSKISSVSSTETRVVQAASPPRPAQTDTEPSVINTIQENFATAGLTKHRDTEEPGSAVQVLPSAETPLKTETDTSKVQLDSIKEDIFNQEPAQQQQQPQQSEQQQQQDILLQEQQQQLLQEEEQKKQLLQQQQEDQEELDQQPQQEHHKQQQQEHEKELQQQQSEEKEPELNEQKEPEEDTPDTQIQVDQSTAPQETEEQKPSEIPLKSGQPGETIKVPPPLVESESPAQVETGEKKPNPADPTQYEYYYSENENGEPVYYYEYTDEAQTQAAKSGVSTETVPAVEESVLDPNQITPRVSGECFRFDCASSPDHSCCSPKITKKRQISGPEYFVPQSHKEHVTYTVTRVEKSFNTAGSGRSD